MKKNLKLIIAGAVLLLIVGGVWYWGGRDQDTEPVAVGIVEEKKNQEIIDPEEFDKYNKTLERHKITGVENLEGPYKKVTVHDGEVTFSFEVPDNWLTETRNSGEVEMNEEELREFWGTIWGGDIRAEEHCEEFSFSKCSDKECSETIIQTEMRCGKPVSDYADLDWEYLKGQSGEEMQVSNNIPISSVSNKSIIYAAGSRSGYQIDITLLSYDNAKKIYGFNPQALTAYPDIDSSIKTEDKIVVSSIDSLAVSFNQVEPPFSGKKRVFIPLMQDKKIILLERQGYFNNEVVDGFERILKTFLVK